MAGTTPGTSGTSPGTVGAGGDEGSTTGRDNTSASISSQDFVTQATQSNLAEIELGRLAERNASSQRVKEFARQMVTDHQQAGQRLRSLATMEGLEVPQRADARHLATLTMMRALRGNAFDRQFMQQMVQDHQEAVSLYTRGSRSLSGSLQSFASQTLPKLQQHHSMAQSIQQSIATDSDDPGSSPTGTGSPGGMNDNR